MFSQVAVLALAGLAAAQTPIVTPPANNGTALPTAVTTVTRVVERFTTVCPEPTIFTYNGKGYTVTAPTTLTITDCPCTITETSPLGPATAKPTSPAGEKPAPPAQGGEKPAPPAQGGEQPAPPAEGGEQPTGGEEIPPVSGASQAQAGALALAGLFAAAVFAL